MRHTNRLINESSPYLLQHAHNPVDWYAWGDEALQRAKNENKPILVSIGYSACHWCHVMERESFEDAAVAAYMNEHFINIKIDREERPDLDHIYMDAVQVMTGSGGWPLNVFLTPAAKPFYGGTYFPPQPAFNRASWTDVLKGVINLFTMRQEEVQTQAEGLTQHLLTSNKILETVTEPNSVFTRENADLLFKTLIQQADKTEGGFGAAPKFPQTFAIQFLLRYYHYYGSAEALQHACVSLDKMLYGGIYDQAGGGFSRYATDSRWLVPHFEKMLYDNALLLITLSEAYQITHHQRYARVIAETMDFIERELMSAESGFYSALDADSEGEEGRFYVWDKKEIDDILQQDATLFCEYYGISAEGNWEGKNILHVALPPEDFAGMYGVDEGHLAAKMKEGRQKLLERRQQRVRPLLDNKMLLGWNALMNTACSKAYMATGEERYRELAVLNMGFLYKNFHRDGWFHSFSGGEARYSAFLDDGAYLIQALLHLQEITGESSYLVKAENLTEYVIAGFSDEENKFFVFTHASQTDIIVRKKEIYDGAVPSGNSVMAGNLLYLSGVFDNREWKERAVTMTASLTGLATRYPLSFAGWGTQLLGLINGMKEVVVTGEKINGILFEILHIFIPSRVFQSSSVPNELFPLLKGKRFFSPLLIYVCENYVCGLPFTGVNSFAQAVDKHRLAEF